MRGRSTLLAIVLTFAFSAHADFKPVEREWTILLYAAGDEIEVQEPTRSLLRRIERTTSLTEDGPVRVIAQYDDVGEDPNHRYWLRHVARASRSKMPDTPPFTAQEIAEQMKATGLGTEFQYKELDSGSPTTLKAFLKWGVRAFPAKHYALIVAGHSWGQQGLMQDFFVDGKELDASTIIKNYELRRAMKEVYREEARLIPTKVFDLLMIDACTSGQIDVLLEWVDVFHYFAGTAIETPFFSLPYEQFLEPFAKLAGGALDPKLLLEDHFLKPMLLSYVKSHTRGGALVGAEKQTDAVQYFAIRNAELVKVAGAFRKLLKSLPKEAGEEFRSPDQDKTPELDRVADIDHNADLWEIAKGFDAYSSRKNKEQPDKTWGKVQKNARALAKLLGANSEDTSYAPTRLSFATYPAAKGAWAQIEVDEVAPFRDLAACVGVKAFGMLNAAEEDLVPIFTDSAGKEVGVFEVSCNDLGEAYHKVHPEGEQPNYDGPHPLGEIFGHKIAWPSDVKAYLTESPDPRRRNRLGSRTLSIWIPKKGKTRAVRLSLAATEHVQIDYLSGKPEAYLADPEKWARLRVGSARHEVAPYTAALDFPRDHLYVGEVHSNGAHLKRGMGVFLGRELKDDDSPYQWGRMPLEKVEPTPYAWTLEKYFQDLAPPKVMGEAFYRVHRINETSWPDFLFGER